MAEKKKTKYFFKKLYNRIVKEKASPEYIAKGWAIGMFYGCLIPFGFQLICSIPTAFMLKGSKIGATFGTLITNHFTIFIIYPLQCFIGNHLIGGSLTYEKTKEVMANIIQQQNYSSLMELGVDLIISFFVGGALFALIMTPITYITVKKMVVQHRSILQKRRERKKAKQQE